MLAPWGSAGQALSTEPGPSPRCRMNAAQRPQCDSSRSLLGDIGPTDMKSILQPALPAAGRSPLSLLQAPSWPGSITLLVIFHSQEVSPWVGACVHVRVPLCLSEQGKTHILSLLTELIK